MLLGHSSGRQGSSSETLLSFVNNRPQNLQEKRTEHNNQNGCEWRQMPELSFKRCALIGPLEAGAVNSCRYGDNIRLMILITGGPER